MRLVIQRVTKAEVRIHQELLAEIGAGMLILAGISKTDTIADVTQLAEKVAGLRIFEDHQGKMNRSIQEISGQVLVVPQFTIMGDCRKGRRPDFYAAASPQMGREFFDEFCMRLRNQNISVRTGAFQQHMMVSLINDGPVTLLLDSKRNF